jgi:hypothetical protein
MSDLLLKQCGRRGDDPYDIADGAVVGRIMFFSAAPGGLPWLWTIAPSCQGGRATTHGYEATRDSAMQAFAQAWHRET